MSLTGGTYTQSFDTLGSTFDTTASTLPTGWYFAETGSNANTTYGVDDGTNIAGNTYSYGIGSNTERAFGTLLSGSLTSTIGAQFTNNTGTTITELTIQYDGEQWRRGATGRQDRLDFQFSTNATSLTSGTYTDVDTLDYVAAAGTAGPLDGNVNSTVISSTITGLSVPDGGTFWIRWVDFNATNSDDGLAVDNFSITPAPVPEPGTVFAVATLGLGMIGTVRRMRRR